MNLRLKCGFQEVDLTIFRQKSLNKGKKLVESFHVSEVEELIIENQSQLTGVVLRETPGAHSTRKHENVYNPTVELNLQRQVIDTDCNCKAGRGYCKHAAAICIFVNTENTLSKTDQPMVWNRPSKVQLEKYQKGSTIENLFPSEKGNREKEIKIYVFRDVINISAQHLLENCGQNVIIKKELELLNEKETKLQERIEEERRVKSVLKRVYDAQNCEQVLVYKIMKCKTMSDGKLKLLNDTDHLNDAYFCKNIVVTEDEWLNICFKSKGQSESSTWYQERFSRITASSRAHRIKTRETNFDTLAEQFVKEKYKTCSTPAMRYGLQMESEARKSFINITNFVVHECGLVISMKQPFLACSPDGIICNDNKFELLEIKCPYSCKNSEIANFEKQIIFVPYLKFCKGELQLKESDKYFTQIQVAMYILNIETCHLFIYSTLQQVHIQIPRDNDFLSLLIPKIERFYFNYFLHHLKRLS